jgi:hypothetical protein
MCGIVGYVGSREAAPIVLQGLRQLEYRGYDSAGLAVMDDGDALHVRRASGKLNNLSAVLDASPLRGSLGVGHTRWATHGAPVERNAHPHSSPDGRLVVVQNGIVENFVALRARLGELGYTFRSDTDTEVIVHLIHYYYTHGSAGGLVAAVRQTLADLQGTLDGAAPPTLRVLVHTPSSPPPAWDSGADAELRRRLPAGVAIDDRDGALATKLGLRTSGHVLLFAADGRLRFTGGVTAGRGHEGDNRAGRTLAAMLGDAGKPQASTAVFGCPLQADSSPHDGPCCDHERPRLDPTAR